MATTIDVPAGGYRYIPGAFQSLRGLCAGWLPDRAGRIPAPGASGPGFATIRRYLSQEGLPLAVFCACELRLRAPFTDGGFVAFNRHYCGALEDWDIMRNDKNPVARSNICPEQYKPAVPSFHAFCFARPAPGGADRTL